MKRIVKRVGGAVIDNVNKYCVYRGQYIARLRFHTNFLKIGEIVTILLITTKIFIDEVCIVFVVAEFL